MPTTPVKKFYFKEANMRSFLAHRNGSQLTGFTYSASNPSGLGYYYNTFSWPTTDFNEGSGFNGTSWTPVPSGGNASLVQFSGQLWLRENATGNPANYVAKYVKSTQNFSTSDDYHNHFIIGDAFERGACIANVGTFPNSVVINLGFQDIAQPGEIYKLILWTTSSSVILDGHHAHTWWSGAVIREL